MPEAGGGGSQEVRESHCTEEGIGERTVDEAECWGRRGGVQSGQGLGADGFHLYPLHRA